MGVEAGSAPTDLPDLGQVRVGRFKLGPLLEWICGKLRCQRFKRKWLVAGSDVQIEITPCAPPERLEGAVLAAVGEKDVGLGRGLRGRIFYVSVPVAFVLVIVVEGFPVGKE